MQVVEHKQHGPTLIFQPPEDKEQLCLKFCKRSKKNPNLFAVDWNAYNKHALDSMGIQTPDLTSLWRWPGRYSPWEHQVITVEQLLLNRRIFNLLEMRLGKTDSGVQAAEFGFEYGMFKRVLVLAPKSIIRSVWQPTWYWVNPKRKVYLGDGPVQEMEDFIDRRIPEVIIANHDKIKFCIDQIMSWKPDLIILDESTKFKHNHTDKFTCLELALQDPKTWFWPFTGTPCPKTPTDVYGLAGLVSPKFKEDYPFMSRWQEATMFKSFDWQGDEVWRTKAGYKDTVADALQPSVRFNKKECFDLPDLMFEIRDISLNKEQKKLVKQITSKVKATVASGETISVAHGADAMNKLFQVCGGVIYDEDGKSHVLGNAVEKRVSEILDIHAESNSKVIIFCGYKTMMLEYQRVLEKRSGYQCLLLNGDVSRKKRAEVQDQFNGDDDVQFVIGHWEVMQYGMNLVAANSTIYVTPATRPEYWSQGNERMMAMRSATKQSVGISLLCSTSQEKRAYNRLKNDAENEQDILTTTELFREVFINEA